MNFNHTFYIYKYSNRSEKRQPTTTTKTMKRSAVFFNNNFDEMFE